MSSGEEKIILKPSTLIMVKILIEQEKQRFVPCGIETEFGMICKGTDPWYAGRNFVYDLAHPIMGFDKSGMAWDPSARLSDQERSAKSVPPASEREEHEFFLQKTWREGGNHLLPPGARFYDDAQAELSTPLCHNPNMVVVWSRAGYRWIDDLRKKYQEILGKEYRIYRNNVAFREIDSYAGFRRHRVSYACHENYTISRSVSWETLIPVFSSWFVLRTPLIGAGKVGADEDSPWVDFQMSQRADFFDCLYGPQTTANRPVYNTRDTAYADEALYRRMHVITGDSNMCELSEYLKFGLTSILVMMAEDGRADSHFELLDPVRSFGKVSRDIEFRELLDFKNRRERKTLLDCLKEYADLFWNYLEICQPDNEIYKDVVRRFYEIIALLETRDLGALFGKSDWATKLFIIKGACERKGQTFRSDFAMTLDRQYHDNDHEGGIFFRQVQNDPLTVRIAADEAIERAMVEPPPTRSRWITETIFKFREWVSSSDFWHTITFFLRDTRKIKILKFDSPYILWDEELAARLFSLTLPEFLEAVPNAGLDAVVKDREELIFTYLSCRDRRYDPDDDGEFVQLPLPWRL